MKKKFTLLFIIAGLATTNIQTANAQIWSLTSNSGTVVNTNFIGTKDNGAIVFRTNNIERMRMGLDLYAFTIHGSSLPAGQYSYSLVADGKVLDTKSMMLTR